MKIDININRTILTLIILFVISSNLIISQEMTRTWTIESLNNPSPGYLNFDYTGGFSFFLVDHYGNEPFSYPLRDNMTPFRFLKDGNWLLNGKDYFFVMNQNYQLIDSFPHPTEYKVDFHEVEMLSNGNLIILCTEERIMDLSKYLEGGSKNANVISAVIIETDKHGIIKWTWKALDHFNINDATEDVDLTQNTIDFTHANSICEDLDGNLIVSFRHFDEITKIKKTNGEIIWRMGGSKCKNNQFVFDNDDNAGFFGFSHQHTATILPNGNLLVYDNGNLRKPNYSRAVEYEIDANSKRVKKVWEYRNSPDIYSSMMGSVKRLSNGNTLINWGTKKISEIKPDNTIAMELVYNNNNKYAIYRADKVFSHLDAVTKNIAPNSDYSFADGTFDTGIKLKVNNQTGGNKLTVVYHKYSPPKAEYQDSSFAEVLPARWVFQTDNTMTINGKINLRTAFLDTQLIPSKVSFYKRDKETQGVFKRLQTTVNQNTNEIEANFSGLGELVLVNHKLTRVKLISPESDSKNVSLEGSFIWEKVKGAESYQLQASTTIDFVNLMLDKKINDLSGQYKYSDFKTGTKYFWRVRAINFKDTTQWSDIYSLVTKAESVPTLNEPVSNSIAVTVNPVLKWNQFHQDYLYTINIAENDKFTLNSKEISISNKNQFTPVQLSHNKKYYWRVRAYNNNDTTGWSDTWNFLTTLESPQLQTPSDSSINIDLKEKLTFNNLEGIKSAIIQISDNSNFIGNVINDTIHNQNYYSSHNLKEYTVYYWRIKSLSTNNQSDWTESWCFTTKLKSPSLLLPHNNLENASVITTFSWSKTDSAKEYQIQIAGDEDFSGIYFDYNDISDCNYQPSDLPPNHKIYWKVKSKNGKHESDWSDSRTFVTGDRLIMHPPKLSYPNNNSVNYIFGFLSWIRTNRHLSYKIQISADDSFFKIIKDTIVTNSFSTYNLDYEKSYYWRVKAFSKFDSSDWSESWTLLTGAKIDNVILFRPRNEQLQLPLNSTFRWYSNSDADGYQFQLSNNKNFNVVIYDSSNINENNISSPGLEENKTYYWRVRYFKDGTPSNWSNIWQFSTKSKDSLARPKLVYPTEWQNSLPLNIILSWNKVENSIEYEISISKDASFYNDVKKIKSKDTFFLISELDNDNIYYWRVRSINNDISSNWSGVFAFVTEMKSPVIINPKNGEIVPVNSSLNWKMDIDNSLYSVVISYDKDFKSVVVDTSEISDMKFEAKLLPNSKYYWRVKAVSNYNSSNWSEIAEFKTSDPSDVNEHDNFIDYNFYPNPAEDYISFENQELLGKEYKIYTIDGKLVFKSTLTDRIRIKELQHGSYFILINNSVVKFIK